MHLYIAIIKAVKDIKNLKIALFTPKKTFTEFAIRNYIIIYKSKKMYVLLGSS